jgi:hydrogenase maturation protein HypF
LTRAGRENLPALGVQHHHAHIAACMAEHGLPPGEQVIGVAFDGTGYGEDGAIWGGEFLIGDYDTFRRVAHLAYFPLPGGDAAVRRPSRTALGLLASTGLDWDPALPPVNGLCAEERQAVRSQIEHGLNAPPTSSIGRLFDAVAALAGVRQRVNYEAQAAIELESLADPDETRRYEFDLHRDGPDKTLTIDPFPLLQALLLDYAQNIPVSRISARFHNGLAHLVLIVCRHLRDENGLKTVALSGGVWQNITLLSKTVPLLRKDGFEVLVHRRVPTNDGGVALGQLAVANARLKQR